MMGCYHNRGRQSGILLRRESCIWRDVLRNSFQDQMSPKAAGAQGLCPSCVGCISSVPLRVKSLPGRQVCWKSIWPSGQPLFFIPPHGLREFSPCNWDSLGRQLPSLLDYDEIQANNVVFPQFKSCSHF